MQAAQLIEAPFQLQLLPYHQFNFLNQWIAKMHHLKALFNRILKIPAFIINLFNYYYIIILLT